MKFAARYLDAVDSGDRDAIEALDALITQVEGKPTEFVHRTDNSTRTVVVHKGPDKPPEMPA